MGKNICVLVFIAMMAACSTVFAGPSDNAQEFQRKAMSAAMRDDDTPKRRGKTVEPRKDADITLLTDSINTGTEPVEKQEQDPVSTD